MEQHGDCVQSNQGNGTEKNIARSSLMLNYPGYFQQQAPMATKPPITADPGKAGMQLMSKQRSIAYALACQQEQAVPCSLSAGRVSRASLHVVLLLCFVRSFFPCQGTPIVAVANCTTRHNTSEIEMGKTKREAEGDDGSGDQGVKRAKKEKSSKRVVEVDAVAAEHTAKAKKEEGTGAAGAGIFAHLILSIVFCCSVLTTALGRHCRRHRRSEPVFVDAHLLCRKR